MAFQLTRTNTGIWVGAIGATVTIDVRSVQPASVVRITYAGKEDGTPPFQFDIKKGLAAVLVATVAVKNGQEVEILEIDGAQSQVLKSFFWSKEKFFDFVQVRGE